MSFHTRVRQEQRTLNPIVRTRKCVLQKPEIPWSRFPVVLVVVFLMHKRIATRAETRT